MENEVVRAAGLRPKTKAIINKVGGLNCFVLTSARVLAPAPKVLGSHTKTHLHTPKSVTYHEQLQYSRFMIGHSLGRMESRCSLQSILMYNL